LGAENREKRVDPLYFGLELRPIHLLREN